MHLLPTHSCSDRYLLHISYLLPEAGSFDSGASDHMTRKSGILLLSSSLYSVTIVDGSIILKNVHKALTHSRGRTAMEEEMLAIKKNSGFGALSESFLLVVVGFIP